MLTNEIVGRPSVETSNETRRLKSFLEYIVDVHSYRSRLQIIPPAQSPSVRTMGERIDGSLYVTHVFYHYVRRDILNTWC